MKTKMTLRNKRKSFDWSNLALSVLKYTALSALGCAIFFAICGMVLYLMALPGGGTGATQNALSTLKTFALLGAGVGSVMGFIYGLLPSKGRNAMDGFLSAIIDGLMRAMTFPF